MTKPPSPRPPWSPLPEPSEWVDTLETLHLWTQIIGKIRMGNSPWLNHSWSVPLYVSPTGLGTSLVPHGTEAFEWSFDFLGDRLDLTTTTGHRRSLALEARTVADFYAEVMETMSEVGMPVTIDTLPNEIPNPIRFPDDTVHNSYDAESARALWRALVDAQRVLSRFRAGYLGKASPVHFFWGSFDLAVTRFSGRVAPVHPGGVPHLADDVTREAYSHEVTSCGFWPGNRDNPTPVFYAYAYPTPPDYGEATVSPTQAFWLAELGEFVLPYADVIAADAPDQVVFEFVRSAHDAAAQRLDWDQAALQCPAPRGPDWWTNRPAGGYR